MSSALRLAPRSPRRRPRRRTDRRPRAFTQPPGPPSRRTKSDALEEPKLADVSVFFVRSQDAVGKMAPIGRVGKHLRLEAETGVRAIVRAVEAGDGTIQFGCVIELNAGLGRTQLHRQPILGRMESGGRSKTVCVRPRGDDEVRIIGLPRGIADLARRAKVVRRAGDCA